MTEDERKKLLKTIEAYNKAWASLAISNQPRNEMGLASLIPDDENYEDDNSCPLCGEPLDGR